MWVKKTLQTWGRNSKSTSEVSRPERQAELFHLLQDPSLDHGVIAYAGGRSYGDMPLNDDGRVILTARLNRILDFDAKTGILIAEAGVTFAELLECLLPQGWAPAVIPGTLMGTLGGAIANDVHGKNHRVQGNFGRHVLWIELMLPQGVMKQIDRENDANLFFATLGGLGLTGIINRVCLQLLPASPNVSVRQERFLQWEEGVTRLEQASEKLPFTAAWLDYPTKEAMRGILHQADFTTQTANHRTRQWRIPFYLPFCVLNSKTRPILNRMIWKGTPESGREFVTGFGDFINPLDKISNWNSLYGPKGCYQLQCVVPQPQATTVLRELLQQVADQQLPMNLAVLKVLGSAGEGILSFPKAGLTLAMDFSVAPGIEDAMRTMIDKIIQADGRVYLAKDAVMTAEQFHKMYPQVETFKRVLSQYGCDRVFQSNLSRRLGITL
jgi:decaprenylphospho-beta-D-ribofuranose 2-oxidase